MLKRLLILTPLMLGAPSLMAQTSDRQPLFPSNPSVTQTGELTYLGGLVLSHPDGRFGGISGLRFIDGRFVAVTDMAKWIEFRTGENAQGHLQQISNVTITPIRDAAGLKLEGGNSDAEAVAIAPDGGLLVAFERNHRILHFADTRSSGFRQMRPPVGGLPGNGGYEAMTALADGSIIAIAERSRTSDTLLTGFVAANGDRTPVTFKLKRRDGFRPTDMVQMPGGDILLLERYYRAPSTVAARVSRIAIHDVVQDAEITPTTLATIRQPALVDNMEGIAIRPAPDGGLWIYLASDDNFSIVQRTILMKFAYYPTR